VTVLRSFFGQQVQGELLATPSEVSIPIGLVRGWDVGASYEWVYKNKWEGFTRLIDFGLAKSADILYVLAGQVGTLLPDLGAWRDFVTEACVRSSGRIKYWEVWNEPVYAEPRDPERIYELAREAWTIIKAHDPTAVVLTPSFNELLTAYGFTFAATYLELARREPYADAVAFHSYDGPEAVKEVVSVLRQRTSLPLWNTETASLDLSATFEENARAGVERCVWNAQIANCDDYDATEGLGLIYSRTYKRLTSPSPWWRRLLDFLLRRD
jgi:hypothetical protein